MYFYCKNKKKKKLKFFYKIIIFLTLVILFAIFFILFVVNPIVISVVESKVNSYATIAVNNAALTVFDYNLDYDDLIDIRRDANDNITYLAVNSIKINRLALETVKLSQIYIDGLENKKVGVPLGTLSGLAFLSGTGNEIEFRIVPIGAVKASYKSVFESAGINQTRHNIFIEIVADIKIILPMQNSIIQTVINIYVAESIIVGKIPDVYLGNGGKLTLIPSN